MEASKSSPSLCLANRLTGSVEDRCPKCLAPAVKTVMYQIEYALNRRILKHWMYLGGSKSLLWQGYQRFSFRRLLRRPPEPT